MTKGKLPLQAARKFDLPDQMRYDFLMKLFSTRMNVNDLEKKYEGKFFKTLWKEMAAFTLAGSFRYFSPNLHLTPRGRYLWVIMMREFFIAVNNFRDYCRKQAGLGLTARKTERIMDDKRKDLLRHLPKIDEVIVLLEKKDIYEKASREIVREACRDVVQKLRDQYSDCFRQTIAGAFFRCGVGRPQRGGDHR